MAAAFSLYSAALLTYSISAWRQMKQDANEFLVADSKRRAVALGDLVAELRNNALGYADIQEIRTYLTNRDLGMSPRYGLNYSLKMIEEHFAEHSRRDGQRWGTGQPRIVYYQETGEVLADTALAPASSDLPRHLDEKVVLSINPDKGQVLAVAQVDFRDRVEGLVAVATPIAVLYRNLLPPESTAGYHELLLTANSQVLPKQVTDAPLIKWLTRLPLNLVTPVEAADGTVALTSPVPGVALKLVTLVPHERAYGHIVSASLLWVAAVVPLLMLFITFRLDRLRQRTERLQEAMAASERERLRVEIRNSEMAEEIQRREAVEIHLKERTEQLEAIFALSPDGFVTFGPDHCARYISPAFWKITGLEGETVKGLAIDAFLDQMAAHCVAGEETLKILCKAGGQGKTQIELRRPGNPILEVALRLGEGDVVSEILYFRDVTHTSEVDRMKNEFLSTAAHELRTPMSSIYGFTELLLTQDLDEETRREFLGIIFNNSELIVSIINELLDLSRIEARGGKDFQMKRLDVCALVREIITHFKVPVGRSTPTEPTLDDAFWIQGDRTKLTQAVSNVLSNAYKYSPAGGAVTVDFIDSPPRIGIRIADQGIGMTPPQLARVFERFYRADCSGSIPGTGLGMSIVKEIVELQGGEVTLDSEAGAGTRVTLWFTTVATPLIQLPD